ncbi:MAG TPA: hypothetical protein VM324_14690 [Egibacteraceae bacterium]|nr:hypothetical protein [Egibacteraceae bacterium]
MTLGALAQLAVLWPAGKVADTYGRRRLAVPAYPAFATVAAVAALRMRQTLGSAAPAAT